MSGQQGSTTSPHCPILYIRVTNLRVAYVRAAPTPLSLCNTMVKTRDTDLRVSYVRAAGWYHLPPGGAGTCHSILSSGRSSVYITDLRVAYVGAAGQHHLPPEGAGPEGAGACHSILSSGRSSVYITDLRVAYVGAAGQHHLPPEGAGACHSILSSGRSSVYITDLRVAYVGAAGQHHLPPEGAGACHVPFAVKTELLHLHLGRHVGQVHPGTLVGPRANLYGTGLQGRDANKVRSGN